MVTVRHILHLPNGNLILSLCQYILESVGRLG